MAGIWVPRQRVSDMATDLRCSQVDVIERDVALDLARHGGRVVPRHRIQRTAQPAG